jgi:hypothetical protein
MRDFLEHNMVFLLAAGVGVLVLGKLLLLILVYLCQSLHQATVIITGTWDQCCGSGMYYPGSDHFLIPGPDPTIFSSRILQEKWNANLLFSCFLSFQEQNLSLSHSKKKKKIQDPRSGKKFIPDPVPGSTKAPDPGSATLLGIYLIGTCTGSCILPYVLFS